MLVTLNNICDFVLSAPSWRTAEPTKTPKPSNKLSPSTSQKTSTSKLDQRPTECSSSSSSTHFQAEEFKVSGLLTGCQYPGPGAHLSLSSPFILSPPSSDLNSVSKSHQSSSVHKGSDSAPVPKQPQVSLLPLETVSTPELQKSTFSTPESTRLSHHSFCAPKSILVGKGSLLSGSPLSSQNLESPLEEAIPLVRSLSSTPLCQRFPPDESSREWSHDEHILGHPVSVTQSPQAERMDEEDNLQSGKRIKECYQQLYCCTCKSDIMT